MKLNPYFSELQDSYLFAGIDRRIEAFTAKKGGRPLIRMGIGDVTLPLGAAAVEAMKQAAGDQASAATFHGYGPYRGYPFLQAAIREYYRQRGVSLRDTEIFVSDGAKSDAGNFSELFDRDNTVLIPDPVYPVYVDANVMAGRKIAYLDAVPENGFLPLPDGRVRADIIYLCSPNNPTGAVYTREQLQSWVDYALSCGAVLLFDAAYEAFIRDGSLPRSIYEVRGAERCAVEFCSLSKTAGFTGTRCGWTVVPEALKSDGRSLNRLWFRRQSTKTNGVSYVVQRGAAAVLTPEGLRQCAGNIEYYRENAAVLSAVLREKGIFFTGGENSPYIWFACPGGRDSWEFFDFLLNEGGIAGTPGAGFGKNGRTFFRLTSFASHAATQEAAARLRELL